MCEYDIRKGDYYFDEITDELFAKHSRYSLNIKLYPIVELKALNTDCLSVFMNETFLEELGDFLIDRGHKRIESVLHKNFNIRLHDSECNISRDDISNFLSSKYNLHPCQKTINDFYVLRDKMLFDLEVANHKDDDKITEPKFLTDEILYKCLWFCVVCQILSFGIQIYKILIK